MNFIPIYNCFLYICNTSAQNEYRIGIVWKNLRAGVQIDTTYTSKVITAFYISEFIKIHRFILIIVIGKQTGCNILSNIIESVMMSGWWCQGNDIKMTMTIDWSWITQCTCIIIMTVGLCVESYICRNLKWYWSEFVYKYKLILDTFCTTDCRCISDKNTSKHTVIFSIFC